MARLSIGRAAETCRHMQPADRPPSHGTLGVGSMMMCDVRLGADRAGHKACACVLASHRIPAVAFGRAVEKQERGENGTEITPASRSASPVSYIAHPSCAGERERGEGEGEGRAGGHTTPECFRQGTPSLWAHTRTHNSRTWRQPRVLVAAPGSPRPSPIAHRHLEPADGMGWDRTGQGEPI